ELLEPLRLGERVLAVRLGERARRLTSGGAQQVEVLPVERPQIFGRGEQDDADQALVVDQRNRRPCALLIEDARGDRNAFVLGAGPTVAKRFKLKDAAVGLDCVPEVGRAMKLVR